MAGSKQRPGVVVYDTGDRDFIALPITTHEPRTDFDLELADWKVAGLLQPSVVRVDRPQTLEKRLIVRKLGSLAAKDWDEVVVRIRTLWGAVR